MQKKTIIEELTSFMEQQFTDFIPEASNLKYQYMNRWVRFHSFYPSTPKKRFLRKDFNLIFYLYI